MKKILFILFFLPILIHAQQYHSCPLEHHFTEVYENPLFAKYLSKYDVKFYHLSLEVSNMNTVISGFTSIHAEAIDDMDTLVFQLIDALEITNIELNSVSVTDFEHSGDAIFIPVSANSGQSLLVTIHYHGDASQNRGFFAGITSAWDQTNAQQVTYTLSEPLNARDWFPVKQVLGDKADSVWVDITCDEGLMAGSNGLLKEIEDIGGGKHVFKWRSSYPIAYYLISLAVADYRDYSFKTALSDDNDSVLVQNFIYDDDAYFNTWKSRIDETGDMITLYSNLVVDYPFSNEKYGHTVAPMGGGMEHQTMTTLANFNFTLVAHELAHQWFGDNITCGNWQDIWINEGFASYFEYLALQNLRTQEDADGWMDYAMSLAMQEVGSVYVPERDAENVNRVFDYGLTYKKGAVLLHMIRFELNNDALFFDVLERYSEIYGKGLATAQDFRLVLDSLSGMDFSCFFDQWYYGKGYPVFNIVWYKQNDTLYIQSLQETAIAETPLFKTTFDIAVKRGDGEEIIRLYQSQNEQLFAIPMEDFVWSVAFDPGKNLLAKSIVEQKFPIDEDFLVGPNPFKESLFLKFKVASGNEMLTVYNLEGKIVLEEKITGNPYELRMSSYEDGPYILVIEGDGGSYREKIVKVSNR